MVNHYVMLDISVAFCFGLVPLEIVELCHKEFGNQKIIAMFLRYPFLYMKVYQSKDVGYILTGMCN